MLFQQELSVKFTLKLWKKKSKEIKDNIVERKNDKKKPRSVSSSNNFNW